MNARDVTIAGHHGLLLMNLIPSNFLSNAQNVSRHTGIGLDETQSDDGRNRCAYQRTACISKYLQTILSIHVMQDTPDHNNKQSSTQNKNIVGHQQKTMLSVLDGVLVGWARHPISKRL